MRTLKLTTRQARSRTQRAFEHLRQHVYLNVPGVSRKRYRLRWGCPFAEDIHVDDSRIFAHTFHGDNRTTICVSRAIGTLPDPYLFGILAHEFGHLLAGVLNNDFTEMGADTVAREMLGLDIDYGDRLVLQKIDPSRFYA